MSKKIRVGLLFGGRSPEHEISLRSARGVLSALDTKKYQPVLIGITKQGIWLNKKDSKTLLEKGTVKQVAKPNLLPAFDPKSVDAIFPVMHGSFSEDGTMQGFLKLVNIPFVGPSVLGSSVGMDKDVTKRLLRDAGVDIAAFFCFKKHEIAEIKFAPIKKKLGLPLFVKPANAGSSVGVSKVRNEKEFYAAIKNAFKFDTKILIEEGVKGHEIEVAVLGNEHPMASIPGEIVPAADFYSYEAKYAASSEALPLIPAPLPKALLKKVQQKALVVYQTLSLEGLTRVDFFVTDSGRIVLNEVNTIPGFTSISMYPKLWEATGISYTDLISRLIELALMRFENESALQTTM